MVLGTLAQQLLYPTWTEELSCTPDTTKSAGIQVFFFITTHTMPVKC